MSKFPPVEKLVPHAGPMVLLDEVCEHSDEHIACRVKVRADGLFDSGGAVPSWLGIEYMAQAVAAFSGYAARLRGENVKIGFLLGTRRFETSAASFTCGETVTVRARQVVLAGGGMSAFECAVSGKHIEQRAMLSVYEPHEKNPILESDR